MALSESKDAAQTYSLYNDLLVSNSFIDGDFLNSVIGTILDTSFQSDTVLSPDFGVDITTPAGTLWFDVYKSYWNYGWTIYAWEISTKVSQYWAKTIETTGKPMYASIVSVTNTADSIQAPLEAALINLPYTISLGNNYLEFYRVVYEYVKQIVWTVTELDSKSATQVYTVNIS